MERFASKIRDRKKTMLIKERWHESYPGMQIYHHFCHGAGSTRGKETCRSRGIVAEGDNGWMALVQNASRTRRKNNFWIFYSLMSCI